MSRPINISDSLTLIPNSYTNTGTYNFTNQTIANAYTNADSTTNNRMTLARNNSTARVSEIYYEFDKSSISNIPSNATISVSANVKYYVSNTTYVTEVSFQLCSGTTKKGTAVTNRPTSGTKYSITAGSWTRDEIDNIRLYVSGTHNASNNNAYIYFYGADITINYSVQETEYEITSTIATNKVEDIDPEGLIYIYEGGNYELNIYANSIDDFKVEDNGTNVTSSLVQHTTQAGETTLSKTAESFTTGFSGGTSMNFYTSSSSTGNNFNYAVGHTAENPGSTSSGSGSWTYVKQNNGSTDYTGYADFVFDFSDIPSNATIKSVQVKCYGAVESSSQTTSHADITLFSGSTQKGTTQSFTSSTNSIITISSPGTWTRAELQEAKLRFAVGYYGGHIFGITWNVTYELPVVTPYYWTYTLNNIQADHTIVVGDAIIEIPEEDPQYEYYPITISSINATTDPGKGTTRVVEGNRDLGILSLPPCGFHSHR